MKALAPKQWEKPRALTACLLKNESTTYKQWLDIDECANAVRARRACGDPRFCVNTFAFGHYLCKLPKRKKSRLNVVFIGMYAVHMPFEALNHGGSKWGEPMVLVQKSICSQKAKTDLNA
ncbi:hypothetical protein L484_014578 [Morus notabilis]|uniref:Uncharacterized protein n=1 Tax=Morus notabilis TaxID=981085 RepID=W9RRI5_9ROSA|nr:hypothetical protein L484_014578 [Morus notabilis]